MAIISRTTGSIWAMASASDLALAEILRRTSPLEA